MPKKTKTINISIKPRWFNQSSAQMARRERERKLKEQLDKINGRD